MHDIGPVSATPVFRAKLPAVWLPLLSHGQLPNPGSIKDRPKYLLSLSRSSAEATVKHQPGNSDVSRVGLEPATKRIIGPQTTRGGPTSRPDASNRRPDSTLAVTCTP